MPRTPIIPVLVALSVGACTDQTPTAPTTPRVATADAVTDVADGALPYGLLKRFAAIGTSISMGVASAGVLGASQEVAWTKQLAQRAGVSFTQPLIQFPGCGAPLAAPLAGGRRVNGEPADRTTVCAPLESGVTLPTQDLAIDGATTHEALAVTPEIAAARDAFRGTLFSRVLPPGETQVTAMMSQQPKLVSVELGGNEVLKTRSGLVVPRVTITPYEDWEPEYDQIVDAVRAVKAKGVLVGLAHSVANFPSFRRGSELYADRAGFASVYVAVSDNCRDNDNIVFVHPVVLRAAAEAQYRASHGLPMATLSCADVPGTQDFVLTPSDEATIDALLERMNAHIRELADRYHFAHFELEALYGRPDLKGPFSVRQFLFTAEPFGSLISLDGIHPTAEGARLLADAVAAALNARYDLGIPLSSGTLANR
jgi:lysophospholipase L1-like esterase